MKRLLAGAVTLAGSLALSGAMVAAAAPSGAVTGSHASHPVSRKAPVHHKARPDNASFGSYAPTGPITSGQNGLATAPPPESLIFHNVNIPGLLTTGTTLDTASDLTAYSRVASPSTATMVWTTGGITYTLSFSASQVSSWCRSDDQFAADSGIVSGAIVETETTNTVPPVRTTHIVHVPQHPLPGTTYTFDGATVIVNDQTIALNGVQTVEAVDITAPTAPAQTLQIANTVCSPTGGPSGILNGDFTGAPPLVDWTTSGTVTVENTDLPIGATAAAQVGSTVAGVLTSTLSQTFTADGSFLFFEYDQHCTTGGTSNTTITVTDVSTGTSVSPLTSACSISGWTGAVVSLRPGDVYTFTVTNVADATHVNYTNITDVAVF
jgi:hypothetical protein